MNTDEKGKLILQILTELKLAAFAAKDVNFCEGDAFFALAFKSDKELLKIARLVGVNLSITDV